MKSNLVDTKPIDEFLDALTPDDPRVQNLLKLALAKPLTKRAENIEPVTELPADAPGWLKAKWPEGGPYHRFRPDAELRDKARHVADWLKAAVQDDEAWLKNLNYGRPARFISITTLDDALAMADADMRTRNERLARQLAPSTEGEETVMYLGGGFRMVRLTTPTALDRESVAMGHCIGQGAYDEHLQTGDRHFFSLRDARNQPHATIEVDTGSNAVLQCQGKENKPPVAKYLPQLRQFLEHGKFDLRNVSACRTGLVQDADGHIHSITELPTNLWVNGDLDLRGTTISSLPQGLRVSGKLNLCETRITSLPDNLRVDGALNLGGTGIKSLPKGLHVGGDLDLRGTPIRLLPEGLEVGGTLNLVYTTISSLPAHLRVGGDLDLTDVPITSLPDGLKVGGFLDLGSSQVTSLPEGLEVGGFLNLEGSKIKALPKGLKVGGFLNLKGTQITSLPEGIVVAGLIDLSESRITFLPAGLKVGGQLDLSNTPIRSLPRGLHVGCRLLLKGTSLTKLPEGLKVGGNLDISGTEILEIPPDADIGGEVIGLPGKFADRAMKPSTWKRS